MEVAAASSSSSKDGKAVKRVRARRRRTICIAVIAAILGVVLLIVILGLTVFKPKRAVTTVNSFKLDHMDVSMDVARLRVNLNITLNIDLSVKNPNKVGFKYTNSSAHLNYRGQVVGEVPIPAGKISADSTMPMSVTLTLLADRFLSNSDIYSDVLSGTLPLSTYTKISGKVYILKVFKFHVVTESTCDVVVNVLNRTTPTPECKYKTKL
ncbi:hypothetical protein L1049_009192 [Liquidambar formosana]|uniref:Late embryogenesis abundant protein LEA-2 subgroup domain-containing protein n=1 Tax=Liquidambar formosana TaxID=63359 RepID=A0AAP0X2R8_LIQFO